MLILQRIVYSLTLESSESVSYCRLVSQIPLCHGPSHDPYSLLNFEIFYIGITLNSLRMNLFLCISSFLQSGRVLCREYFYTVFKGPPIISEEGRWAAEVLKHKSSLGYYRYGLSITSTNVQEHKNRCMLLLWLFHFLKDCWKAFLLIPQSFIYCHCMWFYIPYPV